MGIALNFAWNGGRVAVFRKRTIALKWGKMPNMTEVDIDH